MIVYKKEVARQKTVACKVTKLPGRGGGGGENATLFYWPLCMPIISSFGTFLTYTLYKSGHLRRLLLRARTFLDIGLFPPLTLPSISPPKTNFENVQSPGLITGSLHNAILFLQNKFQYSGLSIRFEVGGLFLMAVHPPFDHHTSALHCMQ